jgi:hypothetical protein
LDPGTGTEIQIDALVFSDQFTVIHLEAMKVVQYGLDPWFKYNLFFFDPNFLSRIGNFENYRVHVEIVL